MVRFFRITMILFALSFPAAMHAAEPQPPAAVDLVPCEAQHLNTQ